MRFITLAVSSLVALASAYTEPNYAKPPLGNPILKPGLNEQVSAGKSYTIEWTPTTEGTVSLVLLRGPSTNVVPIDTLAEAIPNSGHFVWTPSTKLDDDVTHYGLLLVVEGTGQYQWSTQFGVSNPGHAGSSSSSASVSETVPAAEPTATAKPTASEVTIITTESTTYCPESESATATTPTAHVSLTSIPIIVGTGGVSVPVVSPTQTPYRPSTLQSTYGTSTPTASGPSPLFTGAADRTAISLGAVAAGVLAVLAF
ncbi:GPI anchored serine-threonine rich protein [Aspergillus clavatus NRRL 1]|uniref:GPI anchored serine-threonine rich protein n=1 Tax=Aspergillus clavatus (strain ATCC 1007 / CBS 513.65 / DSM 816 / NCTC 3887 / NRRL 1 / QM 1276 / 107) TaxID=344612 RepID=A1CRU4_ASPCL|nr:GPI anchored serine-threonine rich protein [Aspergillus clavatus NRRL 1]EAW08365.1 GPI anchored serine-threonine rich protein [Aspergillus clavatus NRRL 1]